MEINELTTKEHWNENWERTKLPVEIRKEGASPLTLELIKEFEKYLPQQPGLTILEIGGAPGQFLAYFSKEFGYVPYALDYSDAGCQKLRENFKLLNLEVHVIQRDFFEDLSDLPKFDIVFSSGFIEHFMDLEDVVERHLNLLKNGGLLVLGVPNFNGINRVVLNQLAPKLLSMHNLNNMDHKNWANFENKFNIEVLFRNFIGGFEPRNYRRCEVRSLKNKIIRFVFKPIRIFITDKYLFLRRFNSPLWSAYLLGIYRK